MFGGVDFANGRTAPTPTVLSDEQRRGEPEDGLFAPTGEKAEGRPGEKKTPFPALAGHRRRKYFSYHAANLPLN